MPTVNFETTRATLCLAKMGKGCSERFIIPVHRVLSSEWKNFCGGRLDLKTLVKLLAYHGSLPVDWGHYFGCCGIPYS